MQGTGERPMRRLGLLGREKDAGCEKDPVGCGTAGVKRAFAPVRCRFPPRARHVGHNRPAQHGGKAGKGPRGATSRALQVGPRPANSESKPPYKEFCAQKVYPFMECLMLHSRSPFRGRHSRNSAERGKQSMGIRTPRRAKAAQIGCRFRAFNRQTAARLSCGNAA